MKRNFSLTLAALSLAVAVVIHATGCAVVRTYQTDTGTNGTTRKTYTTAFSFFDSKNTLGKLRTSNTDKTQSVGMTDLQQETSGSNATVLVEHAFKGITKALMEGSGL